MKSRRCRSCRGPLVPNHKIAIGLEQSIEQEGELAALRQAVKQAVYQLRGYCLLCSTKPDPDEAAFNGGGL